MWRKTQVSADIAQNSDTGIDIVGEAAGFLSKRLGNKGESEAIPWITRESWRSLSLRGVWGW
jgi:hypothetical protein